MGTSENLQEAFAGESQANRRYLAFAAKADQEGYPQIARLFRAAAEAEAALREIVRLGGLEYDPERFDATAAAQALVRFLAAHGRAQALADVRAELLRRRI